MPRVKPTPHVSSRLKLKNCIFCGVAGTAKNPITDEHIWSDWLKKIIVRRSTRSETRTKISTLTGRPPRIFEPPKQLMGDVHTKKAKVVCAKCNNEWMSDIVTAAIPAATAAATGLPVNLNISDQAKLATWLALQALMADLIAKEPVKLPRADLDYMYINKAPPPEMFIGIGSYLGPSIVAFNHNVVPLWTEDQHLNQVMALSIHTLTSIIGTLYVVVSRVDPIRPGSPIGLFEPYIVQLWPNVHAAIPLPAPVVRQITGFFDVKGTTADELAIKLPRLMIEEFRKRGIISRTDS
jgi:hypothetical protein